MSSVVPSGKAESDELGEVALPEPTAEEQAKLTRAEEDLSMTATICISAPPGDAFASSAQFLRRMGMRGLMWPPKIQRRLDHQYMVEENPAGDVPLLFRGPGESGQLVLLEPEIQLGAAEGEVVEAGWDVRPPGMAAPSVVYSCFSLRTMCERVDKAGIAYQVGPSYQALRPVGSGATCAPRLAADGGHDLVPASSATKKPEELTAADFELVPMPGVAVAGKAASAAAAHGGAAGGGRDLEGSPGRGPEPTRAATDATADSLIRFTDPASGLVVEVHESTARADGRLGQWLLLADMAAAVNDFEDDQDLDPAAAERQAARARRRRRRRRQAGRRAAAAAAAVAAGSAPGVLEEARSGAEDSASTSEVAVGLDDDEGRSLQSRRSSFRTLSTQQKRQQRRQRGLVKAAAAAAGAPTPADDFVLDPQQVAQAVAIKEQAEVRAVENGLSLDTAVGELVGLMIPCEDVVAASAWWAALGFRAVGIDNIPHVWSVISDGFFVIGLLPDPKFRRFGLTFMSPVVSEGRRRMLRVLDVPVEQSMLGFEDEGATKTQLAAVGGWESCTALGGRLTWAPVPGAGAGPGCTAVVMTGVEPLLTTGRLCTVAAGAITIACVVVWAILYLEGSLEEGASFAKVLQT